MQKIKIIVTDDHSLYRQGIINSLRKYPEIEVIAQAENGFQLLELLKHLQPDLITLNVAMPLMNGLATMPVLRKQYPDIKVVVISMHEHHSVICKMMRAGANAYLTKECGSEEIYNTIKTCMEHYLCINETITKAFREELIETTVPRPVRFTQNETLALEMLARGQEISGIPERLGLMSMTVDELIKKLIRLTGAGDINGLRTWALKNLDSPGLFPPNHPPQ